MESRVMCALQSFSFPLHMTHRHRQTPASHCHRTLTIIVSSRSVYVQPLRSTWLVVTYIYNDTNSHSGFTILRSCRLLSALFLITHSTRRCFGMLCVHIVSAHTEKKLGTGEYLSEKTTAYDRKFVKTFFNTKPSSERGARHLFSLKITKKLFSQQK